MDSGLMTWLSGFSSSVFQVCAFLFVAVNAAAVAVVAATRSRAVVQRWTGAWLATNFVLVGAGAGIPLMAGLARAAVAAFTTQAQSSQAQAAPDLKRAPARD
jgi:hypothetical protein